MCRFIKDDSGAWYLQSTQYYVGTGREGVDNFYSHLIASGDMTLSDVIDQIMISVNSALSDEETTDE